LDAEQAMQYRCRCFSLEVMRFTRVVASRFWKVLCKLNEISDAGANTIGAALAGTLTFEVMVAITFNPYLWSYSVWLFEGLVNWAKFFKASKRDLSDLTWAVKALVYYPVAKRSIAGLLAATIYLQSSSLVVRDLTAACWTSLSHFLCGVSLCCC
jgi:hypothetical protein